MKVSTTKTSRPVALGDLVHLRVGAALDQEGVAPPADPLQSVEEVADELDLVVLDPLEPHVADDGPLVAGALRPQGHEGYPALPVSLVTH